ncbi:extracellular solute-binding protein [Mycobacterium montefiorense]|uniref:Spermidine/putrescine ABC transporter substrate-binding protein n=1 Tax=Mycobacterium montefiorense TaxID=154654 RepID=A0AA37PJ75_9MYCO|nr:extracellular solute-binding protein [Mycobacterium montefiorense]GBG38341.1 spermidine/putrescine ABC transporter substrate-binding protein [Mycobacterium montefiorense]GKU34170.1 spermidine/putrescine ABC transporter substrate-binding protein [Mycobacterium montefiorense]GKU38788.1 spermidine/putrescine ABC transporter substrate-binding protein [Mycobacterium montefiorense]GKU48175.1 spermidine/putrescine ABC transporter substrate-binding protein [Mycobacterium montefiorense]GKU49552.1 sp
MNTGIQRRRFLSGSAAVAALLGLPGCAYLTPTLQAAQTEPVKPEIDGDLVYFNWADYVHPSVFQGFEREYGVKVIQSNFDSMESMQAKLAAGNRYDIIFPSAQWVQKMVAANQLRVIDPSTLKNAPLIFDHYAYFRNPWYDQHSAHSIPFTMYKTGIAWRKDKLGEKLTGSWSDLWNETSKGHTFVLADRNEVLGMVALLLGYDVNTADDRELAALVRKFRSLRPYLRGFSSDDYNNLLSGDAWMHQTWSGDIAALLRQAQDPSIYGFEAPIQGAPINTDAYAIPVGARHPGTALLFIDYMLRPENVMKNINHIGYPMPVHGTESTYADIVADFPSCAVTVDDLSRNLYYANNSVAKTQARDAAYTEMTVGA